MNPSDRVTVLVFKDNFAARTFQVPLRWISRLGLLLSLGLGTSLVLGFLALKYYRIAQQSSPARVQDLETELADLKSSYRALEAQLSQATVAKVPDPAVTLPPAPVIAPPVAVAPEPVVPAVPVPEPAAPAPVAAAPEPVPAPVPYVVPATPLILAPGATMPPQTTVAAKPAPPAETGKLPFKLARPQASWRGNNLRVNYNIQYSATDGGSQQGRIVVVVRGPDTLIGHPKDAFDSALTPPIIPSKGEYFSVSRFREGLANFGPFPADTVISEVEVHIFDTNGQLLLKQLLKPKARPAAEAPKAETPAGAENVAPPADPAAAPSGEVIAPGVDQ